MPVETYSLATDADRKITPHFTVAEFACHDGSDTVLVSTELCELLEKIRAHYVAGNPGATIVINSGYRTPKYNRRIGGASQSYHTKGMAADFTVRLPRKGIVPPIRVYGDLNAAVILGRKHAGGLGSYASFTHIDVGPQRRWKG